jgi:thiamine-phosphate pyrophosphorylase
VDYIGLGPFRFTTTKDKLSPVLGIDGYNAIMKELQTDIPIIAIGGIEIEDILDIMITRVDGVAMSGAITKDFKAIPKIYDFLKGDSKQEQKWDMNQTYPNQN